MAELVNGGTPRRMAAHHGMNRSVWTTQAIIIIPFFPLEFSEANGGIAVRDEKNEEYYRMAMVGAERCSAASQRLAQ